MKVKKITICFILMNFTSLGNDLDEKFESNGRGKLERIEKLEKQLSKVIILLKGDYLTRIEKLEREVRKFNSIKTSKVVEAKNNYKSEQVNELKKMIETQRDSFEGKIEFLKSEIISLEREILRLKAHIPSS